MIESWLLRKKFTFDDTMSQNIVIMFSCKRKRSTEGTSAPSEWLGYEPLSGGWYSDIFCDCFSLRSVTCLIVPVVTPHLLTIPFSDAYRHLRQPVSSIGAVGVLLVRLLAVIQTLGVPRKK